MGLHTATGLNRWVKSAEAKTLHAGRLNIGPRLILGFVFIILSMLAADAVILWQFHVVRTQAGRLNDVDQKLVAVLRVHTSVLAFHDRLDALADAEDAGRLLIEAGSLRTAVLEDIRRATRALSLPPFDPRRDPTILSTLQTIKMALPSQIEAVTTLATSGDWRAVHLRLANQVRPLESLTSELVEKVDHEVGEEQAQTVLNIKRVQRLVFLIVPLTALVTLLIAATLGLAITRSITQPLARLVEGSKALARGEFQHQVSVTGNDELAHLGQVFNDTARRLRELYATLQSSEDRLRLVIDTIPAHVWSARPDGSVDFINQRFLESTGLSIEDLLGWGWGSVVHPDDLARFLGKWRVALATGEPMESEVRVRRADGDYRSLLVRNVPLRDELGNIVKWYGTAIDIEDRKRAEEALRQSEEQWRDVFENNPTMYFMVDAAGKVMAVNPFGAEQLGYNVDELVGQPVLGVFYECDREAAQRNVALCLEQLGRTKSWEARKVCKDGKALWVRETAKAVPRVNGPIVLIACEDITEQKRAGEALRQAQADLAHVTRMTTMGELTASLAHEVNQPIAAAVTNANTCMRWLAGDTPNVEEARAAAMRIVKDGTRAGEIISRIRLLFKKGTPVGELVDINEVIREMIVLLRSEAMRYSIPIRAELAADLPQVMGDRVQLQQVMMNLIVNSIDAMKDVDGTRELIINSQRAANEHLIVSVSDTGVGLPRQQADQIFNAFFTTKPHGTGMGLRISRSIVESHGGRLWAADNSPRGASFYFTLATTAEAHE
jgi:PAS domain S-box-containing protein